MRRMLTVMTAALLLLGTAGMASAADCPFEDGHGKGRWCSGGEHPCGKGGGHGGHGEDAYQCPITAKLMQKAEFFLDHADAIGLSEDQVKQIKEIKREAKKTYVRQEADMKIFLLDVEAKMSETPVDVTALNVLADSGSAGMAKTMKTVVDQYARLKGTLSPEQATKAKEIWKQKR